MTSVPTYQEVEEIKPKPFWYSWPKDISDNMPVSTVNRMVDIIQLMNHANIAVDETTITPYEDGVIRFEYCGIDGLHIYLDIKQSLPISVTKHFQDTVVNSTYSRLNIDDLKYIFRDVKKESNLCWHARKELELAGFLDDDSDYNGMLGNAIMELIETFSNQEHSGFSASVTREMFNTLAQYNPIGDFIPKMRDSIIVQVDENGNTIFQCTRKTSVFSNDSGRTWTDIDDPDYLYVNENFPNED